MDKYFKGDEIKEKIMEGEIIYNEEIQKALDLWVELTDVDPNASSFRLGDWDVRSINNALKEAIELDQTYILPLLMLDYFANYYFKEKTFTAQNMLDNFDSVQKYLNKCNELLKILKDDNFEGIRKDFQNQIKKALIHYNANSSDVFELLEERHTLVFLWRDALNAIKTLNEFQFLMGDFKDINPVYVENVYEFWNINSLIKYMCIFAKDGISLDLVRTPDGFRTYFVFAIKNGGNLIVLSDKHEYVHPLQHQMTRNPGGHLTGRIYKNHFPYDLLNIDFDKKGNAYIKESGEEGLVPYQNEAFKLKEIKNLNPNEIIWIYMMFSLIKEKYWKNKHQAKQLSYTGEMVQKSNILIDMPAVKDLAVANYKPLESPPLTIDDVSFDSIKDQWEREPTQHNRWLEERYKNKIPEKLLNLVYLTEKVQWISDTSLDITLSKEKEFDSIAFFSRHSVTNEKIKIYTIQSLDPTDFGTQEKLVKDQKWFGRYNFAKLIQREADKEFEERKDKIINWYNDSVKSNLLVLLKGIEKGEFLAKDFISFGFEKPEEKNNNIMKIYHWTRQENGYRRAYYSFGYLGGWKSLRFMGYSNKNYLCYFNQTQATIMIRFEPRTFDALQKLTGKELPDVLKTWMKDEPYKGNSILDRIDPMDFVVHNPWKNIDFDVEIYLSKRIFNKIKKGEYPNV